MIRLRSSFTFINFIHLLVQFSCSSWNTCSLFIGVATLSTRHHTLVTHMCHQLISTAGSSTLLFLARQTSASALLHCLPSSSTVVAIEAFLSCQAAMALWPMLLHWKHQSLKGLFTLLKPQPLGPHHPQFFLQNIGQVHSNFVNPMKRQRCMVAGWQLARQCTFGQLSAPLAGQKVVLEPFSAGWRPFQQVILHCPLGQHAGRSRIQ